MSTGPAVGATVVPLPHADRGAFSPALATSWDDPEAAAGEIDEPCTPDPAQPRAAAAGVNDEQFAALIGRIVHHDESALRALYDATHARVHGFVLRITQRRALAEEVVEDTYWQVWRQAARFDPARGRPLTWLLAMARSRAIDALRHDQRFLHEPLADDDCADAACAAAPPQDLLDAARGADHLQAALATLGARERQLVALAFFRGLTHEEIAGQEGLPLGTVKSLIRRTLQQLRHLLEA